MSDIKNVPESKTARSGAEPELRFPEFNQNIPYKFLGELAEIKTGRRDTQDRVEGGEYPFFVRSDTVERINEYDFDGEAILTSGDGVGVGKNFHYIDGKFNFHQRVYSIRKFEKNVVGKFIYHYFSEKFYQRVIRLSAKNSVDSVRMEMISKMEIPVPEHKEQQKIAEFLSSVNQKIHQLTEKHRLLTDYKKGVMQQIFTQQIHFKDDQGNDYPEWCETTLGEACSLIKDGTHGTHKDEDESGYFLLSAKNLKNGQLVISEKDRNISKLEFEGIYKNYSLKSGDLLLSIVGTIGEVALWNNQLKAAFQRSVAFFRFKSCKSEFMFYLMQAFAFQKELVRRQVVSAQPGIYLGDLAKIEIILPNVEEQQKIADFLTAIDQKIQQNQTTLNQTQAFKKGLLQKMFI